MKTLSLVAALLLCGPAVAAAQTPPPPQQAAVPTQPLRAPPVVPSTLNRVSMLDSDELRSRSITGGVRRFAGVPRERIQFANRLATMANAGDCPGALKLAIEANERDIAQRLYQACRRPD